MCVELREEVACHCEFIIFTSLISAGVSGLVVRVSDSLTFQVVGSDLTAGRLQATLTEQVANLRCAQVNSASYPL